jgi:hypothetical protein
MMRTFSASRRTRRWRPRTRIAGGPVGLLQERSATFTFSGTDDTTASERLVFAWRLDDGPYTPFSPVMSATIVGLSDGSHRFEVKARDEAGNEDPNPARRHFAVALSTPRGSTASASGVPAGGPDVVLAPAAGTIFQGSRTSFRVSVPRSGRDHGAVALAVTGLPAGVSAAVVPATVVPGQSAQLLVRAAADAPPTSAGFEVSATVQAARGPVSSTATGTLTVLDRNQTALIGRVLDTDREPLPGVAVIVEGTSAFTDANGHFILLDPPAGEQVVLIDGGPASNAEASWRHERRPR